MIWRIIKSNRQIKERRPKKKKKWDGELNLAANPLMDATQKSKWLWRSIQKNGFICDQQPSRSGRVYRRNRHAPGDPLNPFTKYVRQLTTDRYFFLHPLRFQPRCSIFSASLFFLLQLDFFRVASSSTYRDGLPQLLIKSVTRLRVTRPFTSFHVIAKLTLRKSPWLAKLVCLLQRNFCWYFCGTSRFTALIYIYIYFFFLWLLGLDFFSCSLKVLIPNALQRLLWYFKT